MNTKLVNPEDIKDSVDIAFVSIDHGPKKIELTQTERQIIVDALEHQDYSIVKYYGTDFIETLIEKVKACN